MTKRSLVVCALIGLPLGATAQDECSNPEGRVIQDPLDPYGGANNLNGDGTAFDLSDMVYGLQFLFSGGPPPCPITQPRLTELEETVAQLGSDLEECQAALGGDTQALLDRIDQLEAELADSQSALAASEQALADCQSQGGQGLPPTGITLCYDGAGRVVSCGSDTCPGQDGAYQAGCPAENRFLENGDGTVTDTCTGLTWQQGTAPGSYSWCDAASYCDDLVLGDQDDWRLPNVKELQSIVDYGNVLPALDPVFGALVSPREYWSSTSGVNVPSRGWAIDFGDGLVGGAGKSARFRVRAVRGGL